MTDPVRMHGLTVASEVPLHVDRPGTGEPDLVIRWGDERPVPVEIDGDDVLADATVDGRRLYSVARVGDGHRIRFHGTCEFDIAPTLDEMTCHVAAGVDGGVASVLAAGTAMACLLLLRGHLVLHASAVEIDGRGLAFVGLSGMGKSTLATVLTAAGARLVTDDVLRVDLGPGGPRCHAGATETRLRSAAAGLVAERPTVAARMTADGRTAVAAEINADDQLPLHTVVVPSPSREAERVEVTWLRPAEALVWLGRFPRVLGWTDPVSTRRQFEQTAELVHAVGVARVAVPWGPPFPPTLAADLIEALGWPQPTEEAATAAGRGRRRPEG